MSNFHSVDAQRLIDIIEPEPLLEAVAKAGSADEEKIIMHLNDEDFEELVNDLNMGRKNVIATEKELSERFDQMLAECGEIGEQLKGDQIVLNEAFSNFADSLQTDGVLHARQVNTYDYVGRFKG
jgi:hypothetical protein